MLAPVVLVLVLPARTVSVVWTTCVSPLAVPSISFFPHFFSSTPACTCTVESSVLCNSIRPVTAHRRLGHMHLTGVMRDVPALTLVFK